MIYLWCLIIGFNLMNIIGGQKFIAKFFHVSGVQEFFNPFFFIPFLLTPLLLILISAFAMKIGLVPLATSPIEWTTPVFIGGYLATGSISGSILQLFNLLVGAFIYRPFIRLYDKENNRSAGKQMNELIKILKHSEDENIPIHLTETSDKLGVFSKMLAVDLKHAMETEQIQIYYQPQYDNHNRCIGAEALLRWNHEIYGMLSRMLLIMSGKSRGSWEKNLKFV